MLEVRCVGGWDLALVISRSDFAVPRRSDAESDDAIKRFEDIRVIRAQAPKRKTRQTCCLLDGARSKAKSRMPWRTRRRSETSGTGYF